MARILFIAPNLAIPHHSQLLDLQRKHSVVSLTSDVTRRLIYDEADSGKPFQIVHILVDDEIAFDEAGRARMIITLPGGEILDAEGVSYILKRAGGASLFCNSCFGYAIANYVALAGGAPWAIGNTLRVNINDAWVAPQIFYQVLSEQPIPDPWAAFRAIPPDLYYGYAVDLDDVSVISARPVYRELAAMLARITEINGIVTKLGEEWKRLESKIEKRNLELQDVHQRDTRLMALAVGFSIASGVVVNVLQYITIDRLQTALYRLAGYLGGPLP